MMERHERTARLAASPSSYVRSHAGDLVAWRLWDDDLAEARATGSPLLVLIGFAACHWCHVLARETFADPQASALINEHFVPVIVDRQVGLIGLSAPQGETAQLRRLMTLAFRPQVVPISAVTSEWQVCRDGRCLISDVDTLSKLLDR